MTGPLIKSHTAEGAITKYRICKPGTADGKMAQATASTETLMGVSTELSKTDGETVDIVLLGWAEVEYGGAVTRGDPLTSDANGKAVAAAPAAGTNANIIGFAPVSGVDADVVWTLINPSRIQG